MIQSPKSSYPIAATEY